MNKETLEEVAENTFGLVDPILGKSDYRMGYESGLIKGVKWMKEKMYSEEEFKKAVIDSVNDTIDAYNYYTESQHNPPPMNGEDYYNQTYDQNK